MNIQLIAIDLDGTLLNSEKEISPRTVDVIRAARKRANVHVVLASARPPRSTLRFYRLLELDTPMISYNGALVYDPPSKRVIMHRPIPLTTAKGIITLGRMLYPEIAVSAEVLDHWYTDRLDKTYMTAPGFQFEPELVAPIRQWLNCEPTKLLLLGEQRKLFGVGGKIHAQFPHQVSIVQTEEYLLQVMHSTVSKVQALRAVAWELGIDRENVMAIGDNTNDVDMLEWAGYGVAMANATAGALAVAKYVTSHNDAEGVAEAIEKMVL